MHKLFLNPWPFNKDEQVTLFWFCTPFRGINNEWLFKCFFKRADQSIVEIIYPWALLPYMKLGRTYSNNRCHVNVHSSGEFTTPHNYEIVSAFCLPPKLLGFYSNSELGKEQCVKFSVCGTIYYIPCLEIIRRFLAPRRFYLNLLLSPRGLDFFTEYENVSSSKLEVRFNENFPIENINKSTISHFAWLRYEVFKVWYKVYSEYLFNNIALMVPFPFSDNEIFTYTGLQSGNNILVLELLQVRNVKHPFSIIEYSHPSLDEKINKDPKSNIRIRRSFTGDISLGGIFSTPGPSQIIETDLINISFNQAPIIRRINETSKENKKQIITYKDKRLIQRNGTPQDFSRIGNALPIEFKSNNTIEEARGLEVFLNALEYMKRINDILSVDFFINDFQSNSSFSLIEGTMRRKYAVASINSSKGLYYIFEVARPDGWSISTLLLKPISRSSQLDILPLIIDLANKLTDDNGHWDKYYHSQLAGWSVQYLRHAENRHPAWWACLMCKW